MDPRDRLRIMSEMRAPFVVLLAAFSWASITQAQAEGAPAPAPDDEAPAETPAESDEDYDPRQMRTEGLDDEQARSRFRIGQALYNEGRFLEAAREFESSYELSNRSSLLFNAYLSYRDAGRLDDSVRVLERYLGADPDVEDADRLRQRLAAMRVQLNDEQERARAEQAERERLEAEQERLERERIRAERDAELARERARRAEQGLNPIGYIVGGIGLSIVAGGAVAGGIARNRVSDLEDNCPNDRCALTFNLESKRDSADRAILTADILLATGIAVTAVGIGLLFLKRSTESTAPDVSFGCGPNGCNAEMRVGF